MTNPPGRVSSCARLVDDAAVLALIRVILAGHRARVQAGRLRERAKRTVNRSRALQAGAVDSIRHLNLDQSRELDVLLDSPEAPYRAVAAAEPCVGSPTPR